MINRLPIIPASEVEFTAIRAQGAGGQNVNKVASKAELRWQLVSSPSIPELVKARLRAAHPAHVTVEGEFLITSQEYRDQERNRQRCLEKLAEMILRAATPPKPRVKTKPSKASKRRRVEDKRKQSARKASRRATGDE